DLRIERPALLRLAAEQREEAQSLAALLARLRDHAVELGLLLGGRFFVTADLLGAPRIGEGVVDGGELRLEPHPDRVLLRGGGRGPGHAGRRQRRCALRRRDARAGEQHGYAEA